VIPKVAELLKKESFFGKIKINYLNKKYSGVLNYADF